MASISIVASPAISCCSIHDGKSVNVARKCVTITCVPSTVTTSKIFAAASGVNDLSRVTNR